MSDEIPEWATDRACDLLFEGVGHAVGNDVVNAFARYIMQHEEPPVDKDVLAVREVIASQYADPTAMAYIQGHFDKAPSFQDALSAYRKHKQ